jgi:sugar phosphate isomerase/epimerase
VQLGIGTYAFPWAIGVPGHNPRNPLREIELCQRAVELGVRVVQFADNLPLTRLSSDELDALEGFCRDRRLAVELGTRGILTGDLPAHLALAQRFHAPFVRLVLDADGHEPSVAEAARLLRPHVEAYARAGIRLGIENHDRFSAADLLHLIEDLGTDRTGIVLDTVNSLGALETPEVVLRALAPFVLNLHLKDFTIRRVPSQMGFVIEGCPAGRGRLNIPSLLAELSRANPHYDTMTAILELWTPMAATIEETIQCERRWVEQSVRRVRSFIPC